jgi:hypothetical protein
VVRLEGNGLGCLLRYLYTWEPKVYIRVAFLRFVFSTLLPGETAARELARPLKRQEQHFAYCVQRWGINLVYK